MKVKFWNRTLRPGRNEFRLPRYATIRRAYRQSTGGYILEVIVPENTNEDTPTQEFTIHMVLPGDTIDYLARIISVTDDGYIVLDQLM